MSRQKPGVGSEEPVGSRERGAGSQGGVDPETERLKSELAEMESLAQRVQADFANYRRRSEEERGVFRQLAHEEVLHRVLPILDNLDRAATHVPEELTGNDWVQGVSGIHAQLLSTLSELGVERISSVGERFEPSIHEAIAYGDQADMESNAVSEEFEPGWRLGERVIRPAKVRVNRKEDENG